MEPPRAKLVPARRSACLSVDGLTARRRGFLRRRIKVTMKTDFVNTQEKEDVPLKVGARPIGKENFVGYN